MKRICVFGDSITWGMGIGTRTGWADLLRNYLEAKSDFYLELYNLGIDRNNTRDLIKRMPSECDARKPDMIIIDIGTNDSLQYEQDGNLVEEVDEIEFENNLFKIINIARNYTNQIIFIGLAMGDDNLTNPLPRSTTGKRFTKKRIAVYNEIIKKVSQKESLAYIDVINDIDDKDFVDGLHPNESGHFKIYNKIIEVTAKYFSEEIVLVDKDDNIIGSKFRSEVTDSDIYRVSALCLENPNGELLLAKRSANKVNNPNCWMPVLVSGTVSVGETYEDNIKKESIEEMGIDLNKHEVTIVNKKIINNKYNFYVTLFKIVADIKIVNLKVDENETSELKWFTKEEIKKQLIENPNIFVPEAAEAFEVLL